jgi:hypothetical protein
MLNGHDGRAGPLKAFGYDNPMTREHFLRRFGLHAHRENVYHPPDLRRAGGFARFPLVGHGAIPEIQGAISA